MTNPKSKTENGMTLEESQANVEYYRKRVEEIDERKRRFKQEKIANIKCRE